MKNKRGPGRRRTQRHTKAHKGHKRYSEPAPNEGTAPPARQGSTWSRLTKAEHTATRLSLPTRSDRLLVILGPIFGGGFFPCVMQRHYFWIHKKHEHTATRLPLPTRSERLLVISQKQHAEKSKIKEARGKKKSTRAPKQRHRQNTIITRPCRAPESLIHRPGICFHKSRFK